MNSGQDIRFAGALPAVHLKEHAVNIAAYIETGLFPCPEVFTDRDLLFARGSSFLADRILILCDHAHILQGQIGRIKAADCFAEHLIKTAVNLDFAH